MTWYKLKKLKRFAEHVCVSGEDAESIIDNIAFDVVCEAPDMDCPAFSWCHNNDPDGQKATRTGAALHCHRQLTRWSKV